MNHFKGDLVYLANGESPVFMRKNNLIYLHKKAGRGWTEEFEQFGVSFEIKEMPNI